MPNCCDSGVYAGRVFSYIDAKKAVESSQGGDQATILPLSPPENSEDTEDTLSLSCYVDLSLTEGGGSSPQTQLRHTSSDLLTTPIISFRDVVFAYPSRPQHACLKAVSVDISSQSVTAFAGASGAGKSSMLALMCALHKPVSGQLSIADTHLSTCSDGAIEELRKKVCYYVYLYSVGVLFKAVSWHNPSLLSRLPWCSSQACCSPDLLPTTLDTAW